MPSVVKRLDVVNVSALKACHAELNFPSLIEYVQPSNQKWKEVNEKVNCKST